MSLELAWHSPGPVSSAFMADRRPYQLVMGPIGSGKTRSILTKSILTAAAQAPSPRDGRRRFKFTVLRDTYRQLWRSVIPTWWKIMPPPAKNSEGNQWEGAKDGPAWHQINFALPDQTVVDYRIEFGALGDYDIEEFMRGYETTVFYLNEADTLAYEVFSFAAGRVGRYPDMADGGPSYYGIWGDCNAPDDENWTVSLFRDLVTPSESLVEQQAEEARQTVRREDYGFFVQPGGMLEAGRGVYVENPQAENLSNLPAGYYRNQIAGKPRWLVRRMVLNKTGPTRHGKPVFDEEWNDDVHVAPEKLEPVPGLPLRIAADAGRTPAALIGQELPNGQVRILREVLFHGAAEAFARLLVKVVREDFPGFEVAEPCHGDPASANRTEASDRSWLELMEEHTGWKWRPAAESNAIGPRLEVVSHILRETAVPGVPAFLLSPACRVVRKGFNSGYCYARIKGAAGARWDETPAKNDYSHPHDALQYWLLGNGTYAAVSGRRRRRAAVAGKQQQAVTEFNVLEG